jgi:hypothetical protein
MTALRALFMLACLAISGCAAIGIGGPSGPCPVALVPSEQIPEGLWRGRLRMGKLDQADDATGMDLIVQTRDGVLALVGLTPFGTRAFALVQRGETVEIDDLVGKRLGARPIWVLDALHRSRWIQPPGPLRGDPPLRWQRGEESIEQETNASGPGHIRRFRPAGSEPGAHPSGASDSVVIVEYAGRASQSVRVINPWCGYEAHIETVSEELSP